MSGGKIKVLQRSLLLFKPVKHQDLQPFVNKADKLTVVKFRRKATKLWIV